MHQTMPASLPSSSRPPHPKTVGATLARAAFLAIGVGALSLAAGCLSPISGSSDDGPPTGSGPDAAPDVMVMNGCNGCLRMPDGGPDEGSEAATFETGAPQGDSGVDALFRPDGRSDAAAPPDVESDGDDSSTPPEDDAAPPEDGGADA
jgi:hypothetical protein